MSLSGFAALRLGDFAAGATFLAFLQENCPALALVLAFLQENCPALARSSHFRKKTALRSHCPAHPLCCMASELRRNFLRRIMRRGHTSSS